MLYNYFKIAIRFFNRNLFYSVLNVLGLSIGLASAIICLLHINYEFSYDKFHSKSENIYRLVSGNPNTGWYWSGMAAPVPVIIKDNIPEVSEYVRIGKYSWDPKTVVQYKNKTFNVNHFLLVDPSFFKVFDFKLIKGSKNNVLSSNSSVVITESNAKRFFGEESPIGKIINVDGKHNYEITGIVEDAPFNSHLDYDFLISFENLNKLYGEGKDNSWGALNYWVYLMLKNKVDYEQINLRVNNFLNDYIGEKFGEDVASRTFFAQPLSKIHFQGNRGNMKPSYDIKYIYIFSAIALAVLIIAIINFINFINAISERRIKEAGLRKTVGAQKGQIIRQFIIESVLISMISLLISFLIIYHLIPVINQVLNNHISFNSLNSKQISLAILLAIIVGVVSGSYIAFYVSSFSVVKILKGIKSGSPKKISFSNFLIVFQIVISSLLIISSIVIIKQLNLFKNKDIGMDKENIVNISLYGEGLNNKIELFKKEVKNNTLINSISASSFIPGKPNFQQTVWWEGQQENTKSMYIILIDKEFLKTLNIRLSEGNINDILNINSGEVYYILNESAVKACGWESGLGKMFSRNVRSEVKGVVKDFNFMSLHNSIDPVVLEITDRYNHDQILINLKEVNDETVSFLESKFKEIFPDIPFEYTFLSTRFNKLYNSELQASKIISFLSVVSVVIALFGVFALISFSIKEKTKEIAIRKVLGASPYSLFHTLTKGFNKLFLIGCLISWPIAYYLMNKWLNNFNYKISLSVFLFLISAILILGIIQLVISIRVVMASQINPVHSLRYE